MFVTLHLMKLVFVFDKYGEKMVCLVCDIWGLTNGSKV